MHCCVNIRGSLGAGSIRCLHSTNRFVAILYHRMQLPVTRKCRCTQYMDIPDVWLLAILLGLRMPSNGKSQRMLILCATALCSGAPICVVLVVVMRSLFAQVAGNLVRSPAG